MSSKSKNPDLAAGRLNRDAGGHEDSHKKPNASTYGTNRLGLQLGPEVEDEAPVVDEAPAAVPAEPVKATKPASPIDPPKRPLRWEAPRPEPPLEPVKLLTSPPPEEKPQEHPWMEHRPRTQRQGGGLSPAPIPVSPPGPAVKAAIPIRGTVILGVVASGLFLMLLVWGIASLVSSDSVEPTGPAVAVAAPPAPQPQAPPVSPPPAPVRPTPAPAPKPRPAAPARAQTDRAMAWLAEQTRELTQPEDSAHPGGPGHSTGSPQRPGSSSTGAPAGGSVAYDRAPAGIRLRGIIHQPGASYADINGRFVQEGQTIGGAKVVRISRFFVEMEADGKRFQLRFKQQAPKPEPEEDEYEDEGDYEDEEQREEDDEDADSRPPRRRRSSRR